MAAFRGAYFSFLLFSFSFPPKKKIAKNIHDFSFGNATQGPHTCQSSIVLFCRRLDGFFSSPLYFEQIQGKHLYFFIELFSLLLKRMQQRLCHRLLKGLTFVNTMLLFLWPYGHLWPRRMKSRVTAVEKPLESTTPLHGQNEDLLISSCLRAGDTCRNHYKKPLTLLHPGSPTSAHNLPSSLQTMS